MEAQSGNGSDRSVREKGPGRIPLAVMAVVGTLGVGLLVYSQNSAWFGDGCTHLLIAQLINTGKRPSHDFFYQHVPLYAYVNAGLFRFVGDSWPSAHVLSALLTGQASGGSPA